MKFNGTREELCEEIARVHRQALYDGQPDAAIVLDEDGDVCWSNVHYGRQCVFVERAGDLPDVGLAGQEQLSAEDEVGLAQLWEEGWLSTWEVENDIDLEFDEPPKKAILNLCPHAIIIDAPAMKPLPPSGLSARVPMATKTEPDFRGIPTGRAEYGVAELPPEAEGHPVIVSTLFAQAYRGQHGNDGVVLLVPDSGPTATRKDGQIVAVKRLLRY